MSDIIYLYLYGMFKKEIREGNIIHVNQAKPIIKWYVRLPKLYINEIIKEMVDKGYLKRHDRDRFELITLARCKKPIDSLGNPLWCF